MRDRDASFRWGRADGTDEGHCHGKGRGSLWDLPPLTSSRTNDSLPGRDGLGEDGRVAGRVGEQDARSQESEQRKERWRYRRDKVEILIKSYSCRDSPRDSPRRSSKPPNGQSVTEREMMPIVAVRAHGRQETQVTIWLTKHSYAATAILVLLKSHLRLIGIASIVIETPFFPSGKIILSLGHMMHTPVESTLHMCRRHRLGSFLWFKIKG